jgi:hypothetical protein
MRTSNLYQRRTTLWTLKKRHEGKQARRERRVETREDEEEAQRKETPTVRAANVVSSGTGAPGTCTARARTWIRPPVSQWRTPREPRQRPGETEHGLTWQAGCRRAGLRVLVNDDVSKRTSRGVYDNGGGVVVNYDDAWFYPQLKRRGYQ